MIKLIGWGWTVLAAMGLAGCFFNLLMRLLITSLDPSHFERLQNRGGFHNYIGWWETYSLHILIVGFVLNGSTLAASVSLLLRRPWARAILQFLVACHIASLVLITVFQLTFAGAFFRHPDGREIGPGFVRPAFAVFFVALTIAFSAGFCIIYALSIAGLRSARVKVELEGPPVGTAPGLKPES